MANRRLNATWSASQHKAASYVHVLLSFSSLCLCTLLSDLPLHMIGRDLINLCTFSILAHVFTSISYSYIVHMFM